VEAAGVGLKSHAGRVPRVLFVTGAYHPEFSAGGLQCRAVARHLEGRVQVRVLTTVTNGALPRHEVVDGVPVSRVGSTHARRSGRLATAAQLFTEALRLVARTDIVHVQGYSTKNIVLSALSRLFRKPLVLHLQTAKHDEPATVRAAGALAWWAFAGADAYVSVSPGLTARYREAGLAAERIREVPNGVDASRFLPALPSERRQLRERLGLPADRPVILFVGVMSPDKQPQILLDAWLRLRQAGGADSTLVFVGATNPVLYELADRLADRVRTVAEASGFGTDVRLVAPTDAVEDYFRAADVFVMPSLREGLPIVLLEAMACGLPVIASRLPGSTDAIIADGANGFLVTPGDAAGFADRLSRVLTEPAAAAEMGAAARRTVVDRYTIERVAERWLEAYQQLLASR